MTIDFFQASLKVAGDFLQTAVIVDDEFLIPSAIAEVGAVLELPDPDPIGAVAPKTAGAAASPPVETGPRPQIESRPEHPLNAQAVVQAFARAGIVAAALQPQTGTKKAQNEFDDAFLRVARRADIVVMDWSMFRDDGRKAKGLIKKLLQEDAADRRLRLIAVYTGEPDLGSIATSIGDALQGLVEATSDEFVFAKEGLHVCILAKKESTTYKGSAKQRVTPLDRLPERLVNEFAGMTAGLLSNVALASIASVRKNTHHLVGKFSPNLDPAYLADSAKREDYLASITLATSLTGREMRNVINQNDVDALLALPMVRAWLEWRRGQGREFVVRLEGKAPIPLDDGVLLQLVERGREATLPRGLKLKQIAYLGIFEGEGTPGTSNHEYSMLSFLDRSHTDGDAYGKNRVPELLLGTVVEGTSGKNKGRFFVCSQAVCDSVRLTGPRTFPFLPLEISTTDQDLAICTLAGERVGVKVGLKQFEVKQFDFDPDLGTRTVLASPKGLFRAHGRQSFGWVAQLRPEQAQRLINSFARRASRVGLDETETGAEGRRSRLDG